MSPVVIPKAAFDPISAFTTFGMAFRLGIGKEKHVEPGFIGVTDEREIDRFRQRPRGIDAAEAQAEIAGGAFRLVDVGKAGKIRGRVDGYAIAGGLDHKNHSFVADGERVAALRIRSCDFLPVRD